MPQPTISFAIPYLAQPQLLQEAVHSVRQQSSPNWELIVVDDASTQPAAAAIDVSGDERITVIRNPQRLGIAANWNRCMDVATAPLVTVLHGDDCLDPDYAAQVITASKRWPTAAAIGTRVKLIDADGHSARSLADTVKQLMTPKGDHLLAGQAGLTKVLRTNYLYSPSLCFRRSLIADVPFDNRWKMVLDLDHIARLLLNGATIAMLAQPLYRYRRHPASTSAHLTRSNHRLREELALYRELAFVTQQVGWPNAAAAARHRSTVRLHGLYTAVGHLGHARFTQARANISLLIRDLRSPVLPGDLRSTVLPGDLRSTADDQHLAGEGSDRRT